MWYQTQQCYDANETTLGNYYACNDLEMSFDV